MSLVLYFLIVQTLNISPGRTADNHPSVPPGSLLFTDSEHEQVSCKWQVSVLMHPGLQPAAAGPAGTSAGIAGQPCGAWAHLEDAADLLQGLGSFRVGISAG